MSKVVLENYVGGRWVAAGGKDRLPVANPATGEVLSHVPLSNAADVDGAVKAAANAFESWRRVPPVQRARYLFRFRELVEQNKQELAEICTRDHGKTIAESLNDLGRGIENLEHACGIPALMMGENLEDVASGIDCESVHQPLGVFAAITPFNFPPMVPLWFLPYAIATGNTVVLKVSEQVPLSWQRMAELLAQTGLPEGVFNMVHGGKEVVQSLCTHPDVQGVSFVGSTEVAQIVYELASKHGKRVQALGGAKNHILILPDAKMQPSVENAAASVYGCAGQRCLAGSVLVAVGEAYDDVKKGMLACARSMVLGDGAKPETTMGPVISPAAKERIERAIAKGVAEGAELLLDGRGKAPAGYEGGSWVGPTLFDKVRPEMSLAREEIFGPVLSLMHAKDFDEAVSWVNASKYGNAASIFTTSGELARDFRYRVSPAMLGVNIGVAAPMAFFPFGGSKASFFGDVKAHGRDSIRFFTDRKVVISRWF